MVVNKAKQITFLSLSDILYMYMYYSYREFSSRKQWIFIDAQGNMEKKHTQKKNKKKSLQINLEKQDKCRQELNFDIMNKW